MENNKKALVRILERIRGNETYAFLTVAIGGTGALGHRLVHNTPNTINDTIIENIIRKAKLTPGGADYNVVMSFSKKSTKKATVSLEEKEEPVVVAAPVVENKVEEEKYNVISDFNKLRVIGYEDYVAETIKMLSETDRHLSDLMHLIEINGEEDVDSNEMMRNIKLLRRKRRIVKNEMEFLTANANDCIATIRFLYNANKYSETVRDKIYNTRVMKEELGKILITSPHNNELDELRRKVKELEAQLKSKGSSNNIYDGEIILKNITKEPTLYLRENWSVMFHNENKAYRDAVVTEAYKAFYKELGDEAYEKPLMDFLVWQEFVPRILMTRVKYKMI